MIDCLDRVPKKDGGCIHFADGYCRHESRPFYRCPVAIASVSENKFDISYSQIRSWERCPKKWYYEQILGLQMIDIYTNVNMRMGAEIQRRLSGIEKEETRFSPDEMINERIIDIYIDIIKERELFPAGLKWEVEYFNSGFHGIIDVVFDERRFGEIKFTTSPDFYLYNSIAREQIEGYFFLNPDFRWGHMMPIRMPMLKNKADESEEKKLERIRVDINKRFNFYFPEYNNEKFPKWGRAFAVHEFRLDEFGEKIRWIKGEIKTACKHNYFIKRRSNCIFPGGGVCDFMSLCDGNVINWSLFEKKTR